MEQDEAIRAVKTELGEATINFQPFRSPHEGLAIILEEYEELKSEVFKRLVRRDTSLMKKEASHVAAMALRFMIDIT